ncbi:unnamed protein product [marine sediment metagenome]|uniref:Uncharacterized protein n=1 Tax=marine sediment metagenome TaxID=412755 RepID=X0YM61_9ZZZZ
MGGGQSQRMGGAKLPVLVNKLDLNIKREFFLEIFPNFMVFWIDHENEISKTR